MRAIKIPKTQVITVRSQKYANYTKEQKIEFLKGVIAKALARRDDKYKTVQDFTIDSITTNEAMKVMKSCNYRIKKHQVLLDQLIG